MEVGYTLTGHTREEQFVFAHGVGGSGKTTFFDTLSAIIGSYLTALRPRQAEVPDLA